MFNLQWAGQMEGMELLWVTPAVLRLVCIQLSLDRVAGPWCCCLHGYPAKSVLSPACTGDFGTICFTAALPWLYPFPSVLGWVPEWKSGCCHLPANEMCDLYLQLLSLWLWRGAPQNLCIIVAAQQNKVEISLEHVSAQRSGAGEETWTFL